MCDTKRVIGSRQIRTAHGSLDLYGEITIRPALSGNHMLQKSPHALRRRHMTRSRCDFKEPEITLTRTRETTKRFCERGGQCIELSHIVSGKVEGANV